MGKSDDDYFRDQIRGRMGQNISTPGGQKGYDEFQAGRSGGPGGGGTACFVSATPILTPLGWKALATLNRGDRVMTFDVARREMHVRQVMRRIDHSPVPVWLVRTRRHPGGIGTTQCHQFLTDKGWVRTKALRAGINLMSVTEAGDIVEDPIVAIEPSAYVDPVHNLITAVEHTFVAHGCVAHNFAYFRSARTLLHRALFDKRTTERRSREILDASAGIVAEQG